MIDENQNRWDRFWAIHEELDALVSQRYRATGVFNPAQIPGSAAEIAIWDKLTDPEFTDILEHVVQSNPTSPNESALIWKHALRDSKERRASVRQKSDSRIAEVSHI
ncbi:MAG: hypothetical protein WCT04_17030 [Planctomycetota bacterium]